MQHIAGHFFIQILEMPDIHFNVNCASREVGPKIICSEMQAGMYLLFFI